MNFKFFICISISLLLSVSYSQEERTHWVKKNQSYLIDNPYSQKNYSYSSSQPSYIFFKTAVNIYWFFISELDGDNCPFEPTCSQFFIDAIDRTNIFQGTLMFSDRFLRDANFINRGKYYSVTKNHHYFDPVDNYLFNNPNLKFFSIQKPNE